MTEQNAGARSTEGSREGAVSRGKRGRPQGSSNKPKSLVPKELANEMLLAMKDQLPPEHFEYMRGVILQGKTISTKSELDTLVLLLSRNLYPALVGEMKQDDPLEEPKFRKDVTERLKVLNSLLGLRNQIDKRDDNVDDGSEPLLRIYANRGIDPDRLRILIGYSEQPRVIEGNAYDSGSEDPVGSESSTVSGDAD